METTIILQGNDAKLWTMMKALESLGILEIRYGSMTINFDGEGKISNIKKETNHKVIPLLQ
jgi:hypothetical protein